MLSSLKKATQYSGLAQAAFSTVRTFGITGVMKDGIMTTTQLSDKKVDAINSPLETLLSAIVACEKSVLGNYCAEKKGKLVKMEFTKAEGVYDLIGLRGKTKSTNKFSQINLECNVETTLTDAEWEVAKKELKQRCPVVNMVESSGVPFNEKFTHKQTKA